MAMPSTNIRDTVLRYEAFINDVLRQDLRGIEIQQQQINAEISDLIEQKHTLKVITNKEHNPNGFKSQVNIGCNFFMEAAVADTSTMLFHIGLNHYLEFTLDEAYKYLEARIKAFERKASELKEKSAATKAHIKLMLVGINELQSSDKT